jgi:hypothetical protein
MIVRWTLLHEINRAASEKAPNKLVAKILLRIECEPFAGWWEALMGFISRLRLSNRGTSRQSVCFFSHPTQLTK